MIATIDGGGDYNNFGVIATLEELELDSKSVGSKRLANEESAA